MPSGLSNGSTHADRDSEISSITQASLDSLHSPCARPPSWSSGPS